MPAAARQFAARPTTRTTAARAAKQSLIVKWSLRGVVISDSGPPEFTGNTDHRATLTARIDRISPNRARCALFLTDEAHTREHSITPAPFPCAWREDPERNLLHIDAPANSAPNSAESLSITAHLTRTRSKIAISRLLYARASAISRLLPRGGCVEPTGARLT